MNAITRITAASLVTIVVAAGGATAAFAQEPGHGNGADDVVTVTAPATMPAPSASVEDAVGHDATADDSGHHGTASTSPTAQSAGAAKVRPTKRASSSHRKHRRHGAITVTASAHRGNVLEHGAQHA